MMKADEIHLLDKTIKAFGPHSYLGPWLAENRMNLVDTIHQDMPIVMTMPNEARREAAGLLAEAQRRGAEIVAAADATAKTIQAEAQRKADVIREAARRDLFHAAKQLELLQDRV